MAPTYLIDIQPIGRRIEVPAGLSLLEAAQQAGVDLVAACGGMGICGTCRVRLVSGPANPITPSEEEQLTLAQRAGGSRLACQCLPEGDVKLEVPPESLPVPQRMQTEGRAAAVQLQPAVRPLDLSLPAPALDDLRSDWTRLQQAIAPGAPLSANLAVLSQLSTTLRANHWSVRLVIAESCEAGMDLTSPPAPSPKGMLRDPLHEEGEIDPQSTSSPSLAPPSAGSEENRLHPQTSLNLEQSGSARHPSPWNGEGPGGEVVPAQPASQLPGGEVVPAQPASSFGNEISAHTSPRLVAALPPHSPLLGLAVDLGSTKLAVYLVDLETGGTLAQTGVMNPQISYGEDVINRIAFANKSEDNRRLLQTRVVEVLNQAAAELCRHAARADGARHIAASSAHIVDAVLVGNTAMHHFFTHLPVVQLGSAPYVPAVSEALCVESAELGLALAPGARVYLPAAIAGYVGGDHTVALLATRSYPGKTRLLVDIGTNTEISLVIGERSYTCSTASGPAFEGAHIHDGMRAAPGAVERVRLVEGRPQVWTVGGQAAVGICGSGILQAIAELLQAGVIDRRGSLAKTAPGVRSGPKGPEYLLVPAARTGHGRDIVITRGDINEIQLAKGAIRAGIQLMLAKAGLTADQVDEWVIAGAFGSFLDLASAVRVGLFPAQPLERFHQVGNAAGAGARQMLLSLPERTTASRLAAQARYVELTVEPEFTPEFMKAMYL